MGPQILEQACHCKNLGVVHAINTVTASSLQVVHLLRHFVLQCLSLNAFVYAVHVPGVNTTVVESTFSPAVGKILPVGTGGGAVWISMTQSIVERRLATIAGLIRQSVCSSIWTMY